MNLNDRVLLANSGLYRQYGIPDQTEGRVLNVDVQGNLRIEFPQQRTHWFNNNEVVRSSQSVMQSMLNNPILIAPPTGQFNPYPGLLSTTYPVPAPKKPRKPAKKKPQLKQEITLDSVVMSDEKRLEIRAAISQIDYSDLIFGEWGFSEVFEKGTAITLLFYGVPGTGKTMTAQAIATETKSALKIVGTADIETAEPGGAERAIQALFATAKRLFKGKEKSQVLLFDECDSLLMDRNEVGPIIGAQINCLLSEIERHEGIIIFTTNRLGKLDPALERRISAKIEFMFPDESERAKIWQRLMPEKAPLAKDVNFKKLATYPLAGGNIKNAVLNAARKAAFEKSKTISMAHFKASIEKEAESLQSFMAAYEDTSHHNMHGYVSRTSTGLSVGKQRKTEMKKKAGGLFSNNR